MKGRRLGSAGYRTSVRAPLGPLIGLADRALPGRLPLSRQLSRRSLWSALPHRPAERPDAVNRLAITVDLDYQADTDALAGLVELVGRFEMPISVAAVGALVAADPGPYAAALAAGHEIVNHSQTHPDNSVLNPDEEFWHLSEQRLIEEIGQAQETIEAHLGVRPVGFRTPHFKDTQAITSVLAGFAELRYNSSVLATRSPLGAAPYLLPHSSIADQDGYLFAAEPARRDAGTEAERGVLQLPLTACPAHRWSPFCSWHGIRAGADPAGGAGMHDLDDWSQLWQRMLRDAARDGLAVVYFDPHDLMRDAHTAAAFAAMLAFALRSGWQPCTMTEIAGRYAPAPAETAAR